MLRSSTNLVIWQWAPDWSSADAEGFPRQRLHHTANNESVSQTTVTCAIVGSHRWSKAVDPEFQWFASCRDSPPACRWSACNCRGDGTGRTRNLTHHAANELCVIRNLVVGRRAVEQCVGVVQPRRHSVSDRLGEVECRQWSDVLRCTWMI